LKIWAGHENNLKPPLLAVIGDKSCDPKSLTFALGRGAIEYTNFLESGDPRGRVAERFGLYFWYNSQLQRSVTEPPWSISHVLE
jgi:hypothetical protein